MLAAELQLPASARQQLRLGMPLLDIGALTIDEALLHKPSRLTPLEFECVKAHTLQGASVVAGIPDLRGLAPLVRSHHERWDGTGYPDGLHGEHIPRLARIAGVADTFEALTSKRPYRPALPAEQAWQELERLAGSHLDPLCVQTFVKLRPRIDPILFQKQVTHAGPLTTQA
jgi:HD-GYP domain-containing protein (c-di-GMP phosphodiesterase class II)